MRIYLVRHAEAQPEASQDSARELTALGWEQAQQSADWLCQQVSGSTRILMSPYCRARQTANVISQSLGCERIEMLDDLIPDGDPLRAEQSISLHARDDVEELIVVSHMPLIASLQSWLEESILTTGKAFTLAEVRTFEASVLAPGLATLVGGYIPGEDPPCPRGDLRSLITRR